MRAMLATLGGTLALLCGLVVVLLPLLLPELSRPRDAFWGALVLLLGLVLVTSADRLAGAPMLAVLCGGLLIGRLATEVGQSRWRALSGDEQAGLHGTERWRRSAMELGAAITRLGGLGTAAGAGVLGWWRQRRPAVARGGKRWVRPEEPGPSTPAEVTPQPAAAEASETTVIEAAAIEAVSPAAEVTSFEEIDILLGAALAGAEPDATSPPPSGAGDAGEPPGTPEPSQGNGEAGG